MAMRPVVGPALASCCTIVSIFGVIMLSVIGYGFGHGWEAFMGSKNDPEDGNAVATSCYVAAMIYAAFILFCGCQLGANRRYSRIQI